MPEVIDALLGAQQERIESSAQLGGDPGVRKVDVSAALEDFRNIHRGNLVFEDLHRVAAQSAPAAKLEGETSLVDLAHALERSVIFQSEHLPKGELVVWVVEQVRAEHR